jgi:hypothetical protein
MAQEAVTTDSQAMHEAIARLYGAVLAPSEWPAALESVAELLQADHAILVGAESGGRYPLVASVRMDRCDAARFCTPEAARLGGPMLQALPVGVVITRSDVVSDGEWEAMAVYNEIIRPANGYYSANARVQGLGDETTFVNFCRARTTGAFGGAETAALQAILPHFGTALELMHRL